MNIWNILSLLGENYVWIGFSMLFLFIYPFLDKKNKEKLKPVVFALIPIIILSLLSVHVLKLYFHIPRPCIGMPWCPQSYSFPSGHATIIFAVASFVLFWLRDRRITLFAFLIATLVSYSRIALGVHRMEDIIGGSMIGISISLLYFIFYNFVLNKNKRYLLRKTIHMSSVVLIPLYLYVQKNILIYSLLAILVVFVLSEILRLRNIKLPYFYDITKMAIKKDEEKRFALSPFLFGLSVLFLLFLPFKNFYSGLVCLSIGDGLSGLIGYLFKTKRKSLIGSFAFFVSTLIFLALEIPVYKAIIISSITTLLEFLIRDESENLVLAFSGSLLSYI